MIALCFLLATVTTRSAAQQQPPSTPSTSPYCKWTAQHTLCKATIGDNCQSLVARGVDDRARQSILQAHNTLRSLVASGGEQRGAPGPQPPASNMQILLWDAELERVAQAWADQCIFEHDCSQCRRVDRFLVGQNLALESTTGPARPPNWKKMITNWYEEVELFANTTVRSYQFSPATGHYSALVWADTNRIGCGFTSYSQDGRRFNLYVCDYGPTGNFIGLPVYKSGAACSQCPNNFICSAEFPNLCEPTKKPLGPPASANAIAGTESSAKMPPIPPTPAAPPVALVTTRPFSDPTALVTNKNNGKNGNDASSNSIITNSNRSNNTLTVRPIVTTSTARPAPSPTPADRSFTCSVGRGDCRASYVGVAWTFQRDSAQEYLESVIPAGKSTELRLSGFFPAPTTRQICLNLRLRETIDNRSGRTLRLFVPATTLLMKPQNGAVISIALESSARDRWVQVGLTISGLNQPFQLVVSQEGPRPDQLAPAADVDLPVDLRLALHSIAIKDGPCL